MTTLSEKLELEPVREVTRAIQSWEMEDEGIEADRQATVVATLLLVEAEAAAFEPAAASCIVAAVNRVRASLSEIILRDLLSPTPTPTPASTGSLDTGREEA